LAISCSISGLRFGPALLQRFQNTERKSAAPSDHSASSYLFVIGTRFMYGFRIIGPMLIGASRLPPKIFLPLNIRRDYLGVDFYHPRLSRR
jgi:membrane protein DedA with SNARE-associated domain